MVVQVAHKDGSGMGAAERAYGVRVAEGRVLAFAVTETGLSAAGQTRHVDSYMLVRRLR